MPSLPHPKGINKENGHWSSSGTLMHSIQSLKDLAQLSTIMQHMSMCIYKLPLPIGQIRCQGFSLLTALTLQQKWYSKNGTVARTIYIISLLYCLHCPHCLHKVTARIVCGRMSVRQLLAKQRVNKLKLVKSDLNLRGTLRRDLRLTAFYLPLSPRTRQRPHHTQGPKYQNMKCVGACHS